MRYNRLAPKSLAQAGFGIIEALIALAAISMIAVAINKQFLGNRENTAIRKARTLFDADLIRLMMVTEENSVCERLNIIGLPMPGVNGAINLPRILYGNQVLLETHAASVAPNKDKALYRIERITLRQTSNRFGIRPRRARATIELEARFFNTRGQEIALGPDRKARDTLGYAEIIIAAQNGSTIDSCYGIYSRRIACNDENRIYNPEGDPSCQ